MTRKNRARYGLSRTYKVSATAKALRGAMIAALATAGVSQSALADTCMTVGSTAYCNGYTSETINVGDELPWDPTVVEFGGALFVDGFNENGVWIDAANLLEITNNGGSVQVDNDSDSWGNLIGVYAETNGGGNDSIVFENLNGTVFVDMDWNTDQVNWNGGGADFWWSTNGDATGVRLEADENITVTNTGFIGADNNQTDWYWTDWSDDPWGPNITWDVGVGDAYALDLWSGNGNIAVDNAVNGDILAHSGDGQADAVRARAWGGSINIDNAGTIRAEGDEFATGVYAETGYGDIVVNNAATGEIFAYADGEATGIGAVTEYGAVTVQNDGNIDVWGYSQGNGVVVANISGYGDVTVGNTGSIQVRQEGNFDSNINGPFDLFGDATGIGVFHGVAGFYAGPNPFMGYGDVSVSNSGEIDVWADGGDASGIGVVSFAGDVSIGNDSYGNINVVSEDNDAIGIGAAAIFADVTVGNDGLINADAYGWNWGYGDAVGVNASAKYGAVDVHNTGRIYADSDSDDAFGIRAYAAAFNGMGPFSYGELAVGDIHIDNSGLVDVYGNDDATGIYTVSENGTTTIDNTGVVVADADQYTATGIRAISRGDYNGDITINNTAVLDGNGDLVGGIIDVYTHSWGWNYNTDAVGIDVRSEGYGDITVANSGRIGVYSEGDANGDAWGIRAAADNNYSNYSGSITVNNSGLIDVYADDSAWGVRADTWGDGGDITVTNSGRIEVSVDDSDAFAIDLATWGYADIAVTNSGTLLVHGSDDATGIDGSNNGYGDLTVTNSGYIGAFTWDGDAYGMELSVDGESGDYQLTVTNSGVIVAESEWNDAFGVKAETYADGDLTISNVGVYNEYGALVGGVIRAESQESDADGIHAYHYGNGDIVVSNSGLISSETYSDYGDLAIGVDMHHYGSGDIRLTNNGVIEATASVSGDAWGIHADTQEGTGNVFITNDYYIEVAADDDAKGIQVDAEGDVTVNNFYTIDAHAWGGTATGIEVNASNDSVVDVRNRSFSDIWSYSSNGDAVGIDVYVDMDAGLNDGASVNVLNSLAGITVKGEDDATGIRVRIEEGSYYVDTQGYICSNIAGCNGPYGYAANGDWVVTQWGYWQDGEGSAPVTVSNTGFIDVFSRGYGDAIGIDVDMGNGNEGELATITNSGIIDTLSNSQQAYGVKSVNDYGDTSIANSGWIYAEGWDDAFGISAESSDGGNITISNSRLIEAVAGSDYAVGILADTDTGNISITSTAAGVIAAYGVDDAVGIGAWTNDGSVTISNAGDVYATSNRWTNGIAARSDNDSISVTNTVDGRVIAVTDDGDAYGVNTWTGGSTNVANAGVISAYSENGWATGIYADAWDDAGITVTQAATGSIAVESAYGDNNARGMNLYSDAGAISVTTAGSISAVSGGYDGYAMGIYADSDYGDITVTNSAAITANANGDYGDAIGIWAITNHGDISVSNSGNVFANANAAQYGWSVGIYTENETGATTIANSGNVRATSDGVNDAWAIYHRGNSVSITNAAAGNIFGVIQTDDAADSFTNSGDWYATEGNSYVSDFGAGNDAIVNNTGARIFMNDSVIDLGYAEGGVNSFMNNGKVFVRGADNVIDMGGDTSVFTNNGASLHFEDGAANDVLTVYGDFAGTGHIVVDANGTSMLADRLYIEGDVVTNTANVVDVYLNNNPTLEQITDGAEIDIVHVTGTSAAANFSLGIVDVANEGDTLYTVSHTLNKHINYSGTNDLFALGFEISGLSQSGVAVSSIAPAVQNLWHLGTGTMFQRQGSAGGNAVASGSPVKGFLNAADGGQVADYQGASGAWVRMFADNGGLTPDMGRDNFGTGGVQQFDLSSSGIEFGAGYAFNDQWTAGLLGGVSEASLKPEVGGRTKVDADTVGAYLTYTPGNGFYLDLTYRAMGFDGQGNGDGFRFKGDADGFGLELGYGFKTDGGLVIEPQFQYSAMDVNLDQVDYFDGDFELTDGKSSQMRGSIALRKTYQSGAGEWTPFASVGVVNETNASNDYVIGGILTGNVDTSGNSTLVEAGATAHYGNMVFSGGVNWKDGGAYDSLFGGQVSVRFTW